MNKYLFICLLLALQTDLTGQLFKDISSAIHSGDTAKTVVLKRSKLETFPLELREVKHLKKLDLSNNRIDSIPKWIGELNELETLILKNNNIKSLPAELFHLTSLSILNLGNNEIEQLPEVNNYHCHITKLELWSNNLSRIPDWLLNCSGMQVLDLRGILIPEEEQTRIKNALNQTKVLVDPPCNCF